MKRHQLTLFSLQPATAIFQTKWTKRAGKNKPEIFDELLHTRLLKI
jgi:hypothetical protein